MPRPPSSLTVTADGAAVTVEGPVEAMDAHMRDACEVRLPEPTGGAGRVIVEWMRGLKKAG